MGDNIKKFVLYLLACNSSEIYTMLICVAAGLPVPFTPIMILWANLIVDVPPALALGVDTPDIGVMERAPRNPKAHIFNVRTVIVLFIYGLSIAGMTLAVYLIVRNSSMETVPEEEQQDTERSTVSRTAAFVTIATLHLFHAYLSRSTYTPVISKNFFKNAWLAGGVGISWIILVVASYLPGVHDLLELEQAPFLVWVYAFAALAVHILIVETIKWVLVRNVFANMAHKKQIEDERAGRAVFYVDV